jgi:hypothetical protein
MTGHSSTFSSSNLFDPARIVGTFNCCRTLSVREVDELASMGIPPDVLTDPVTVASSHVHFDGDQFEFQHHHYREGGVHAFLFLIQDQTTNTHDIVAWSPSLSLLATWLDRAWALGQETIYKPRLSDHDGLPVHRTPEAWLQACRHGICLIRPNAAAHYLDTAGVLLAEDEAHGDELDQLLTRPAPRILIPSSQLKKAA